MALKEYLSCVILVGPQTVIIPLDSTVIQCIIKFRKTKSIQDHRFSVSTQTICNIIPLLIIIFPALSIRIFGIIFQPDTDLLTMEFKVSDNNRQIELLTEQIRIMNQRFFGRRSEASVSEINGQLSLFDSFNEAEYLKQDSLKEPEITEVIIPSYHRKKTVGKRESDLSGLPARIIEHTLSDEELAARFPDGYKELPEEIYKRLHIIPETFIVDEHHVHVYASRNNDGTILKAPRPKDLFRNSIATPALVASIINPVSPGFTSFALYLSRSAVRIS